jgi:hypothetical protein
VPSEDDIREPRPESFTGHGRHGSIDGRGRDLVEDAIRLAPGHLQPIPAEAEVSDLLALTLHCEARKAARRAPVWPDVALRPIFSGPDHRGQPCIGYVLIDNLVLILDFCLSPKLGSRTVAVARSVQIAQEDDITADLPAHQ